MKRKPLILVLFSLIVLVLAFQSLYSTNPVHFILKIPKTSTNTATLLQQDDIKILQELNTCYLGWVEEKTLSSVQSMGITYQILTPITGSPDRLFLVSLRDMSHLKTMEQYGQVFQVEGHHVLFLPADSQPPHQQLRHLFRSLKKLEAGVKIGTIPAPYVSRYTEKTLATINPTITEMANKVSKSNIQKNIQTLQNFVTRDAETDGCERAGDFLATTLSQLGLQVEEDSFNFEGNTSRNIIGYWPGKKNPASIVIISAHYDSYAEPNSTKNAPGADDNASGTAAVLEAAKIMSAYPFGYSIKFILFSAEEWGLYGSAHYAKEAASRGEKIIGVINLDMVSYADHLPEDLDVIVNNNSKWMGPLLESAAQNYATIDVATTVDGSYDYSDHDSFWTRGFPAVLCIEDYEDTNPNYHTNRDTINTLNLDFATQVTRTCLAATAQLAEPQASSSAPTLGLSRSSLYFGALSGGTGSGAQSIWIRNTGIGTLNWSVSDSASWLTCTPTAGTHNGMIAVNVNPGQLAVGTYTTAITITDPHATNSPLTIPVTLTVKSPGQNAAPLGEFATPLDGSTVRSSFPVTGWVLDDIGIISVKIYREEGSALVFIGDAVRVEGARPDVATAYPYYPSNDKAGWGYMLLSYFLPNGGNGIFKLHAIATDTGGNSTDLGVKTITVDNKNSKKPFGTLDTPIQGGVVSSKSYTNWGWVLTPQPNSMATNGSTISVWVDGVNKGHPTYNLYRADIATLFPGYTNSHGAVGYYSLDTTAYANGVHAIQWTATDSAGNTDGIGSRFFLINNTGSDVLQPGQNTSFLGNTTLSQLRTYPLQTKPTALHQGYHDTQSPLLTDKAGLCHVRLKELEPMHILSAGNMAGYMIVNNRLHPLPVGSTLDTTSGTFYWQPGVGFVGEYHLVFMHQENTGHLTRREIWVTITPKYPL